MLQARSLEIARHYIPDPDHLLNRARHDRRRSRKLHRMPFEGPPDSPVSTFQIRTIRPDFHPSKKTRTTPLSDSRIPNVANRTRDARPDSALSTNAPLGTLFDPPYHRITDPDRIIK
jgi:hypothetical protein